MKERLIQITTPDGVVYTLDREDGNVLICKPLEDHCLILPQAPGKQVLDLIALLDGELGVEDDNESP